jgi:hypothetical protein
VEKHISSTVLASDKAKSFFRVEPFDGALDVGCGRSSPRRVVRLEC